MKKYRINESQLKVLTNLIDKDEPAVKKPVTKKVNPKQK
jgi:hypothetical protein